MSQLKQRPRRPCVAWDITKEKDCQPHKNNLLNLIVLISFNLIIFCSCGLFGPPKKFVIDQKKEFNLFKKKLNQICLSSEGKGKIFLIDQNRSFGYETYNQLEKKLWQIALTFPFYGEEDLNIHYSNMLIDNKARVYGGLLRRLLHAFSQKKIGHKELQLFDEFIQNMAFFLRFLNNNSEINNHCYIDMDKSKKTKMINGECLFEGNTLYWQSKGQPLIFNWAYQGESNSFRFEGEKLEGQYFQKINFIFKNNHDNDTVKLKFYLLKCSELVVN